MIKSIQFQEGGYITEKTNHIKFLKSGKEKIEKYKKNHPGYLDRMSDDGIVRNVRLTEDKDYRVVDDGYKHPQLINNILNRKIEFEPAKINLIFGPNASGKSTILKALAAYCQCGLVDNLDGWTNRFFITPHEAIGRSFWRTDSDKTDDDVVIDSINHYMKNNAVIDWDGVPVYSDNFSTRQSRGSFGDMCGSIFSGQDSGMEELLYMMNKKSMSLGQNSIFILNKIVPMMKNPVTIEKILGDRTLEANDTWVNLFNANIHRLEKIYNDCPDHSNLQNTFLFDEMDKSLDIENVAFLYSEYLPALVEKYNVQIIIVSHSPLILTKNIVDNPLYNIISMDEDYTKKCKEMLSKFSF